MLDLPHFFLETSLQVIEIKMYHKHKNLIKLKLYIIKVSFFYISFRLQVLTWHKQK